MEPYENLFICLRQRHGGYPALVGLDESRRLAREQADAACAALAGFNGPEAEFLRALAEYTITRAA